MNITSALLKNLHFILRLCYPKICLACGDSLSSQEEVICTVCVLRLPYTNFHFHEDNPLSKKFWGRVPIQGIDSLLYLEKESKTQQLLYNLKYNARQDVGTKLAEILVERYQNLALQQKYDGIVSVPIHFKKLKIRGYNQCDHFALQLSRSWQIPYLKDALQRNSNNPSQTGKSRILRWENVKDVFSVNEKASLKDKHLLLVDDVLTTGATLEACSNQILAIENTKISILTMACKI
jgi:ComF family protein